MQGVLVIKNVSVKLFSFFNGGIICEGRVCETLQLLQWMVYLWSRNASLEGQERVFSFINGGSIGDQERVCQTLQLLNGGSIGDQERVKLFSFFNGGIICGQGRVCQTLQLLQWRVYWWSRTCLSNSSTSSMEGVLVIKNVSVKLFSFINGGSIGDQERVCQTLQLH